MISWLAHNIVDPINAASSYAGWYVFVMYCGPANGAYSRHSSGHRLRSDDAINSIIVGLLAHTMPRGILYKKVCHFAVITISCPI